ncbi:MAG: 2-oxoacid:acceptor oxidoreductase family protein, partial [Bifidobacteriaceae bacterium]|nr:2-oxoacid:acceptor oxidoreductase family protein [Bifidobacteriaceae bacterium]
QGIKAGVVSVKLLQPFPEAEFVAAVSRAKAVMVLERSDDTALTRLVSQTLFRAQAGQVEGLDPAGQFSAPKVTTAIFGLGGHDVQPRHLVAGFKAMAAGSAGEVVYLGSQFFEPNPPAGVAAIHDQLRAAYPQTVAMGLETEENPQLLPPGSLRIRFHSVGGYGTVATGKLLTDILSGVLSMNSKSAPKYGSEKSGAATNFYITLSPEPVLLTNAELEDVDVVMSPDHQVFVHTNPLKGLAEGGTFILQSDQEPLEVWRSLPSYARRAIRQRKIKFLVVNAFAVAKKHAPSPELETRMMGIAFIGAMIGHVEAVAGGADAADVQARVRQQIEYKFGRKGQAVVDGNMAVISDGMTATVAVEYDSPAFVEAEQQPAKARARTVTLSAAMCPAASQARPAALFDPDYYEDLVATPFRQGTIAEAPVLPGAGLFMPVGSGANKDKGIFRRTTPVFNPDVCTGCLECALACPDSAFPNQVHEIRDLLEAAVAAAELTLAKTEALAPHVQPWADQIRQTYREDAQLRDLAEAARRAAAELDARPVERVLDQVADALAAFPVARTRPFFDSVETDQPGRGGLCSAVVDPWKCTGCLQCIDVCGPSALTEADQTLAIADLLETRFERLTHLTGTPKRFLAGAAEADGDIKRLLLDHDTYYAMTGGHGACRGCGEVTALRLLTTLSHAVGDARRRQHVEALEALITELAAKAEAVKTASDKEGGQARVERLDSLIATLEERLYLYEGGPTGRGPATTVIANSTGCSSVYASTMPFTPYTDPWVNSLFQDAQPLAVGLYEGLVSQLVPEVRALRAAALELADGYDPATDGRQLATISWRDFTATELDLLPAMLTVSGDGAAFDIGFGAMSRVLAGGTPIKAIVLNTGAYSNTGGQASTASYTGQDADLARYGKAHTGKQESRKELGLLASFHPGVFACATSTALHSHFLNTALSMLEYKDGSAVMEVYTPCSTENGIAEDLSNARSRLAVESRMAPLFVHDPRRGPSLPERFSLDGNPEPNALWTTRTLRYFDDSDQLALMQTPLTPAEFAFGEVRFAKQFRRLRPDQESDAVPIAEYVESPLSARTGKTPFIWATDRSGKLIQVACGAGIVGLVEDRRHYWQTLQFLAGQTVAALSAAHRQELAELTGRYEAAVTAREDSLDQIAAAMAELASSGSAAPPVFSFGGLGGAPEPPAGGGAAASAAGAGDRPIWLDPADVPTCNDCGTCYQELPQLFEKTTMVVDGEARVVARMIDGALDGLEVTPELTKRISR